MSTQGVVWNSADRASPASGRYPRCPGECLTRPQEPLMAVLHFTEAEWAAFLGGVHDGEFEL